VRIVLDSSVLLAAIAHPGVCTELVDEVAREHTLVLSRYILDEVARKLRDKFGFPNAKVVALVADIERQAEMVQPSSLPANACRDAKDIPVLGTAVSGQARFLATVDKDLLSLGDFRGVLIVRPGDFWKRTRS
jgi:putative PIN family toxin of toxin-antitoxin system